MSPFTSVLVAYRWRMTELSETVAIALEVVRSECTPYLLGVRKEVCRPAPEARQVRYVGYESLRIGVLFSRARARSTLRRQGGEEVRGMLLASHCGMFFFLSCSFPLSTGEGYCGLVWNRER